MFRPDRTVHPHHHDPERDEAVENVADGQHWFVAVVSNPYRYKTRYALFRKFKAHILQDLGANLLVVECALGERQHQVVGQDAECEASAVNYKEVGVQNTTQLWQKENLMNIGLQCLPPCARYITFVDADIHFANPHVVTEIVHALQIHKVVQPFETCVDLGPHGQVINVHRSFGWCHAHGFEFKASKSSNLSAGSGLAQRYGHIGQPWHTGFCISFRREVLDRMGGLLEVGVLGSGDHHMFSCMVGKGGDTCNRKLHPNYRAAVLDWQRKADRVIQGDLGYVPGTIMHIWHGPKAKRKYHTRWEILVRHQFDPTVDTTRNAQGVLELTTDKTGLRDDIRRYFLQRSEDEIGM